MNKNIEFIYIFEKNIKSIGFTIRVGLKNKLMHN